MYPSLSSLSISMKRSFEASTSSSPQEQFAELVRRREIHVRWSEQENRWTLVDTLPATRTPATRVWKTFGFQWNSIRHLWEGPHTLPPLIVHAIYETQQAQQASQTSAQGPTESYEDSIIRVLNKHRARLFYPESANSRYMFSLTFDRSRTFVNAIGVSLHNGTRDIIENRDIWKELGMKFDNTNKQWYGPPQLAPIVMRWYEDERAKMRAQEEQRRRQEEERRREEAERRRQEEERRRQEEQERRQRQEEERRRFEEARQQRLARDLERIRALSDKARPNPSRLNDDERAEYDRLRLAPGVPSDLYLPWQTLYDEMYVEIRRKIRDGEALNDDEVEFLVSAKHMAIVDAIEATRIEIEDMEVNERLRRLPAHSDARGQEMEPVWIAHVIEAVLELTDRLKERILQHLRENNLDIGTTRVPQETYFNTPLGRLRVYVRNQAAARRVVWSVYFDDPRLRAIADQALLDAGYESPVQIRESKSLIIAMNAVATSMERSNPAGEDAVETKVRRWARQNRAHDAFFGNNVNN